MKAYAAVSGVPVCKLRCLKKIGQLCFFCLADEEIHIPELAELQNLTKLPFYFNSRPTLYTRPISNPSKAEAGNSRVGEGGERDMSTSRNELQK